MNKTLSYVVILALFIALLFTCNTDKLSDLIKSHVDTVITVKSDTFWAKDTIFKFKYKTVNKPIIVYKDPNIDTSVTHIATICDTIRVYNQTFEDTNLTVFTKDTAKGVLLGHSVSYKLKIPVKIIDSVFIKIHEVKEIQPKGKVFVGASVQLYPIQLFIAPSVSYLSKKDRLYQVHYDLVSKSVIGSVGIKIHNPLKRKL